MARDLKTRIVLEVDGKQYRAELERVDGAMKKHGKAVADTSRETNHLENATKLLGSVLTADLARRVLQSADNFNTLQSRIRTATRATGDYAQVSRQLFDISQRTGNALETTVSVFQSLARSAPELNATNDQMLQLTQLVQQLGVISGASNSAMSAGLLQFSQAMSAGVVRAEEMNSLLENIPEVANRIARGMGMTVGELRNAVLEGRVLSRDVFASLMGQAADINRQFGEIPENLARSTQTLSNSIERLLGALDRVSSTTTAIGTVVDRFQRVLDFFSDQLTQTPLEDAREREALLRYQMEQLQSGEQGFFSGMLGNRTHQIAETWRELQKVRQEIATLEAQAAATNPVLEIPITGGIVPPSGGGNRPGRGATAKAAGAAPFSFRAAQEAGLVSEAEQAALIAEARFEAEQRQIEETNKVLADYQRMHERNSELLRRQRDEGTETYRELRRAVEGWSRSFADAVIDGERNFKGLVDSMLREMARLALAKSTEPLFDFLAGALEGAFSGGFGSLFGGGNGGTAAAAGSFRAAQEVGLPGRAAGGPVQPGRAYVVGERGPEVLVMGGQAGTVIPNGAGGGKVSVTIHNQGTPQRVNDVSAVRDALGNWNVQMFVDDMLRGGPMSAAIQNRFGV